MIRFLPFAERHTDRDPEAERQGLEDEPKAHADDLLDGHSMDSSRRRIMQPTQTSSVTFTEFTVLSVSMIRSAISCGLSSSWMRMSAHRVA